MASRASDLVRVLRELGLTRAEASIYVSLLEAGAPLSVSEISLASSVSKGKCYAYLRRLEELGGVVRVSERPLRYAARSLEEFAVTLAAERCLECWRVIAEHLGRGPLKRLDELPSEIAFFRGERVFWAVLELSSLAERRLKALIGGPLLKISERLSSIIASRSASGVSCEVFAVFSAPIRASSLRVRRVFTLRDLGGVVVDDSTLVVYSSGEEIFGLMSPRPPLSRLLEAGLFSIVRATP